MSEWSTIPRAIRLTPTSSISSAPYATEIPNVEIHHLKTPSPLNPLGVKGVGEAGCIAVGPVIASASRMPCARWTRGSLHHVPITPSMIHQALTA